MGEREPRQNQPRFRLQFESGIEYLCYKFNTEAYLHSEEPDGDHLYHRAEQPEDSCFIFRDQITNFDEIVEYMAVNGFDITKRRILDANDREAYQKYLEVAKKKREQKTSNQSADGLDWISPRKEKIISKTVDFLIYLAQRDKLE